MGAECDSEALPAGDFSETPATRFDSSANSRVCPAGLFESTPSMRPTRTLRLGTVKIRAVCALAILLGMGCNRGSGATHAPDGGCDSSGCAPDADGSFGPSDQASAGASEVDLP